MCTLNGKQWVLLPNIHHIFREFANKKIEPLKIGKEMVGPIYLYPLDLVRASSRRHVLNPKPWHIADTGACSKSICNVPFNVLL
ncbi:hypothetical protein D3C84_1059640 [compost metagenome]